MGMSVCTSCFRSWTGKTAEVSAEWEGKIEEVEAG